ncbi:hypothetical protein Tco_0718221 [Tanacetum coccineum]
MSSTKVEYVAVVGCCANILWMKSQLTDYDIIYGKVPIFCNNTSAIAISNNPVLYTRTKHIDIRYHFIRDHILKGDIELHFIPTQYQLDDIFTKPLDEPTFKRLIMELEEVDDVAEQVNTAGKVNTAGVEVNTVSEINTGSIKLNTGIEQASIVCEDKGQREGKAPMLSEETPKKSKEQILQEEASLAETIRLDSLQKEEEAKQIHLDALLAQRIAEEEELTEQQKKRKAQVQFEAQHYTNEDWDLIRAKLEANAELSKSMLGSVLQGEEICKEKGGLNQGTWKLNQLRKLSFEEVKKEFDKLVKQVESFAPISFEATKDSLKRFGEELQTKTPKRLKEDKD